MASADNPLLNSLLRRAGPSLRYRLPGNLDLPGHALGRHLFRSDVPQVPIGLQNQGSMFDLNDFQAEQGEFLINRLPDRLRSWRDSG